MTTDILLLPGGVGLFLFGMQTMTAALRDLGSGALRRLLARLTTSPLTGAMAGAGVTVAVQSSSATMVMTIGFVGAGLLTFPQAVGVILGANVGSTATGWVVALLGLKLDLGTAALPALLGASLLRLVGRGRWARGGEAAAGLCLVLLGLDLMQAGAVPLRDLVTPQTLPPDTLAGRFRLLLMGAGIVLVIQSSGAGVAMTLVLYASGAIGLPQAAALVIGMDMGTTGTAVLAAMGGLRDMRRTALAHVAYNVVTGLVAFALLGLAIPPLGAAFAPGDPTAVVVFHTLFNLTGTVALLPFVRPFARAIEALVPGRGAGLTERLEPRLLSDAAAAMDAARGVAQAIAAEMFQALARRMRVGTDPAAALARASPALEELQTWLSRIAVPEGDAALLARYAALLHLIDHLHRLANRMTQDRRITLALRDRGLARPSGALAAALARGTGDAGRLARLAPLIEGRTGRLRRSALLREHAGLLAPEDVFAVTDAMRWLARSAAHAERIVHYLAQSDPARPG